MKIDEELQSFAQWLWDNHYLVDEAFTIKLVEQYNDEQLKEETMCQEMTIDEEIAKYKEITNTDANCPGHCNLSCDKCVQESKQLVEWLEELKTYRLLAHREFEKGFDCGYKTGYYKTIDKCVEIVKFHKDTWDGIEWAIKDLEDLKEREID